MVQASGSNDILEVRDSEFKMLSRYNKSIMKYKFFKPDKDWRYNSMISKTDNKWLFYGEGYREASEIIEKQILEIDRGMRGMQDFLIFPYCSFKRRT